MTPCVETRLMTETATASYLPANDIIIHSKPAQEHRRGHGRNFFYSVADLEVDS